MTVGIGYPLYGDNSVSHTPAYSGGAWDSDLPLSNLKDRRLARVARSTDTKLASTRLHLDLGVARSVGILAIPKHTMSKTGAYVRAMAQLETLLFDYEAGDDITVKGGTFTRASTAYYVDRNGVLRSAASGVIRDAHFIGGVRHTLLEKAGANLVTAAFSAWTNVSVALTESQSDPTGGTAATLLATTSGGGAIRRTVAFTADATKAVSVFLKPGTSAVTRFGVYSSDIADWRHLVEITWASLAIATVVGSGTVFPLEALAGGWYRLSISVAGVIAANTNDLYIYPAGGSGEGTCSAYFAQAENALVPSSAMGISGTRVVDALSFTYATVAQAMTVYVKAAVMGTGYGGDLYIISNAAFDVPWLHVQDNGTNNGITLGRWHNGTAASDSTGVATASADVVEWRHTLSSAGVSQLGMSVNGAAEVVGTAGTARAIGASFSATTKIIIGGVQGPHLALQSFRIMAAEQTLATTQGSVYDSGWTDAWPSAIDAEEAAGLNVPWVLIPATAQSARYWTIQVDDFSNAAGYVDLARLVVAKLYEPTINMNRGASVGLDPRTVRTESDGGATIFNEKPTVRTMQFVLADIAEAEAFSDPWRIQRLAGTAGQLYAVYDTDDTSELLAERSFLGTLKELNALEEPYFGRHAMAFAVVEEL